ncbi:MAG: sodium transporter, partial [Bacteroidota bacterium]
MNYIDYLFVGAYILLFLFLGQLFSKNKDSEDYFLGGKSFGWFPLSMSTIATQLSAISFISAPAFVGLKQNGGMQWLTYEFAVPLTMIFLMVF